MDLCIFCLQCKEAVKPFCKDNPGEGCTYGLRHDFGDGEFFHKPAPKVAVKKVDKQVCLKCSLHSKHPTSATNGCEHEYPSS